jgi:hypothetical protein
MAVSTTFYVTNHRMRHNPDFLIWRPNTPSHPPSHTLLPARPNSQDLSGKSLDLSDLTLQHAKPPSPDHLLFPLNLHHRAGQANPWISDLMLQHAKPPSLAHLIFPLVLIHRSGQPNTLIFLIWCSNTPSHPLQHTPFFPALNLHYRAGQANP